MGVYYKRIRDLREDNDRTQQNIADILNVGLTTYRRWETGERTIPTNYLTIIAKIYKVSTDYILELTDDPTPRTEQKGIKKKQVNNISGGKNINITQN